MHRTPLKSAMKTIQRVVTVLVMAASILIGSPSFAADFDLCGCADHPESLGTFDTRDASTWPPGTTLDKNWPHRMFVPLPPDGVLVFDSFLAMRWKGQSHHEIWFTANEANTPVTLLVMGDVTIDHHVHIRVDGRDGNIGTSKINGRGGAGGPGGFRGGDGAYQDVNGAGDGGEGHGPGGGSPGTVAAFDNGGTGRFPGRKGLRPLIGGSGGGGGASKESGNCSASGGGGGGGAILIAVNGTIRIDSGGGINADGGHRGRHPSNGKCATLGGPGSGGAIRLVAQNVTGGGYLVARSDRADNGSQPGVIRIESVEEDALNPDETRPPAIRTSVIGPLVNPVAATVAITTVGGKPVPENPKGWQAGIDVMIPAPGVVKLQLATSGVPVGTTVEVAMKPKVGGTAMRERTELNPSNCNPKGVCTAFISFELPSGAYYAEAIATFQTP